jgi:hypothetical protein
MIGSEIQDGDGHSGKLFELSDASGKWVEAQVRWGGLQRVLARMLSDSESRISWWEP